MKGGSLKRHESVAPFQVCGETLEVRADRTLYWPREGTLMVADLHLGQAATLGAQGVPLPRGSDQADLDRLGMSLQETGAERLIVLGDQYHHAWGQGTVLWEAMRSFRAAHAGVDWVLVRGNHDQRSDAGPVDLEITRVEEIRVGPFQLRHDPGPGAGYVLGGHLHPGFQLARGLRVPCFHFFKTHGVLPSFGGLTGMVPLTREPGDRVIAIGEGTLFFF